jgi:hypothetical protein
MIRKIIISACLFLSAVSFSQEGTSSPYSFYGIGEAKFNGTLENRSMGGISMAKDSTHINLQNPAAYSNLKWTTFTIGGSSNQVTLKNSSESVKTNRTTLDYMAIGIPLGKFGAVFGLMPITSVGYRIQDISADQTQNNSRIDGTGGVNRVFLGFGYKLNSHFSLGVNGQYNFGKIESNRFEFVPSILNGTRESNITDLSGFNYNLGMMYDTKINSKLSFFSSLTYTPESTLKSDNTLNVSTVSYSASYGSFQDIDKLDEQTTARDLRSPQKLTFGAGIGDQKKWILGAEVAFQDAANLSNAYNSLNNVEYGKYQKYSLGGYFVPNSSPYANYFKRIVYRGGLKFEKTGLIVNSTSIDDVGLSFGLGMPIIGTLSNLNLGIEIGKKGTTSAGLIQENYINFNASFSLNDKWFVRSKFY